jgi:DNA ligase (NAD+)
MTHTEPHPTISDLERRILAARHAYYNGRDSGLTDHEFDAHENDLRRIAPEHPLLQAVGAPVPVLTKVKHKIHMGSQLKLNTIPEFEDWFDDLGRPETLCTLKLDGFSLALYYVDGILTQAVTRGDGVEGEDITANAVRFKGVPVRLNNFTGAVRGEGVMVNDDWLAIDPDKESNPRNLAAGIARRKDGTDAERITFYAFDLTNESNPNHLSCRTELGKLNLLKQLEFNVPGSDLLAEAEAIIGYYNLIAEGRSKLPYWIDGVILKVNDCKKQLALGFRDNRPKGQVAWKFEAEEATSTLRGVTITVGHTGKIIPTAMLDPVQIGGTTVSNALLCNWDEIRRLGLKIGDVVRVIKAGDIIPKIIGHSALNLASLERQEIPEPYECPVCEFGVGHQFNTDGSDTADLYCLSPDCPAKSKGKIKRWVKSLDIQGIGDEVLEAMTAGPAPMVKTVADLYKIAAVPLSNLMINGKKVGTKRAANIMLQINKTRQLTIEQFLGSLGIKHLGKRRVHLIIEAAEKFNETHQQGYGVPFHDFTDVQTWLRTDMDVLILYASVLGIPGIAADIRSDLEAKRPLIKELLQYIQIIKPKATPPKADSAAARGPLSDRSFCLTGTLSKPRKEVQQAIEAAGGTVKDDVRKGLNYLVVGLNSSQSSKSLKAVKLGVKVIGEKELNEMIGG